MKDNIQFLITSLNGGGAEKIASNMINYMVQDDYNISAVTILSRYQYPDAFSIVAPIERFNFQYHSLIDYFCIIPLSIFKYNRSLKKKNIHYSYSFLILDNMINIISGYFNNDTKIIISVHTSLIQRYNKNTPLLYVIKFIYSRADVIISISNSITDELKSVLKINENKIVTIPNPICIENIVKLSEENIVELTFDDQLKYIIMVGRLEKHKGVNHLINISKYINNYIKCKILICGDGELFDELNGFVKENKLDDIVILLGWKKNPYKYIARSNLLILLSDLEALPTVLIEGLALGKKIISTDCKQGPREILLDGELGRLIPILDNENPVFSLSLSAEEMTLANVIVEELKKEIDYDNIEKRKKRAMEYDIKHIMNIYYNNIFD
jgi:glycosyltransferase involved in cell wall biosynthesis